LSITTPLEKIILHALRKKRCTAAELASLIGMAQTNFSLARNSRRSFPLPALLNLLNLADVSAVEKIKVLEWIAFEQVTEVTGKSLKKSG
jgi:transcriptional regulator with XRE-family HTH domain